MGQKYSQPKPGAKLQVIGAGLSRTGTASFSRALEILLNGPVYHGGTQVTLGPSIEIKTWIKVLRALFPPSPTQTESSYKSNLELIKGRTDGFVAITDAPGTGFVPELMAIYPDAKVICTVRDPVAWEKSMESISSAATQWFLRFVLFPLPGLRHFVDYINALREQWLFLYGETEPATTKTYNRHIEWLKEIVPKEKLVFFDVKDGWEPLCKALDVPVPKDVPFPRINDSEAIDEFAKKHVQRGLSRWLAIVAVGVGTVMAFKWL